MAEFLRTQDISARIAEIIRHAEHSIVLISPVIKINDVLFGSLKDAGRKSVKTTLVFGKEELKPDVKEQLAELENISVYFRKTLHAKCFYNEKQMVITSMNLYDFSEVNNIEMGILITAEDEANLFQEAKKEAESIVRNAEKVKIKKSPIEKFVKDTKPFTEGFVSVADSLGFTITDGHCIKCGILKKFNIDEPLCKKCYSKWRMDRRDPNFAGEFCHKCGNRTKTTMSRPLCSSCEKI